MTQVSIPSADLKALADAALDLVKLKMQQGNKDAEREHKALLESASVAYESIQVLTDVFGVYRCPKCGTDWNVTSMGQALKCPHCGKQDVEPVYTSGVNDVDAEAVLRALADHEKAYPAKAQKGEYFVDVQRTGFAIKTVSVNAFGPATAQLNALERAGDVEFRPEYSSSYEAQGVSGFTPDVVGETFVWEDCLRQETPRLVVTVKEVLTDEMVRCSTTDGEITELPLSELKHA
jgi:ribosomal protein L37AE/L43A